MKEAKLQLNTDKTELLLIGTKQQLQKINMSEPEPQRVHNSIVHAKAWTNC